MAESDDEMAATITEMMQAEQRRKPDFIGDPKMDKVVDVVLRLAMEISVLRERLDVHEAIAEANGNGGRQAIEDFVPDEAFVKRQQEARALWVSRVLDDLK